MYANYRSVLVALSMAGWLSGSPAATIDDPASRLSVQVSDTGTYTVKSIDPAWIFSGTASGRLTQLHAASGKDRLGKYSEITFRSAGDGAMAESIRVYSGKGAVLFSETALEALKAPPAPFPDFTTIPAGLRPFSFKGTFANSQFKLNEDGTPWLLFDDQADAVILSPASNFMIASMWGDGGKSIASGFNKEVTALPKGFSHSTLVVVAKGINQAWDTWGASLTALQGKKTPANDADVFLKYLGYWTDNGAAYYYNYDKEKGYEGTLVAVRDRYRDLGIPIRYMQLDSWWYEKSTLSPEGIDKHQPKKKDLPQGLWNAYGGLLEYTPDPFVFPDGLGGFEKKIGLPLMTHNRWMDPKSPYHDKYRISGLAVTDPKWWSDILSAVSAGGVTGYEQDWLANLYQQSPELHGSPTAGDEFCDGMANAAKSLGMSLQYCMALPRFYLQGSKYGNLTTSRVSGDRFEWNKWERFLYTSRLATAIGTWPWADVFRSGETDNFLLATLSAGMVGIGDFMGEEYPPNIDLCVRKDGTIVKPDVSALPTDSTYVNDADGRPAPMLACAWTDHGAIRTLYCFAFARNAAQMGISYMPSENGVKGAACALDFFTGKVSYLKPGETFHEQIPQAGFAYYIIAPVTSSGIAFLGDAGKFVPCGKKRIASIQDEPGALRVTVTFAKGEEMVTLRGYAAHEPKAAASAGKIRNLKYDPATSLFTVEAIPQDGPVISEGPDPIRQMDVTFTPGGQPSL